MTPVNRHDNGDGELSGNTLPQLPKDWCWAQATDICESVRDGTHDTPKYVDEGVPLVTSKNLSAAGMDFGNTKLISWEDHEEISKRSGVEPGDVLFAMIGTVGNPVVVTSDRPFSIKNVALFKKNVEYLSPHYLAYWLWSPALQRWLKPRLKGTTQQFAPLGLLRSLPVPVSPLQQQHRIVNKLEELLSDLDAGVAALNRVRANLKRYRASVLKAAVEGKLTEEWRREHPAKESAEKLLGRVLKERRSRWEEQQVAAYEAKGKKPPKGWQGRYKEPAAPDSMELADLPDGWQWTTLDALMSKIVDGTHHTPTYTESGIPFLSVKDVRNGLLFFNECKYISPEQHELLVQRCNPEVGDLLVTKSGTIGRVAIVRTDTPFSLFVSVALLKPASKEVLTEWVAIAFQAWLQTISIANQVKGSTIKNLHLEDFRVLPVPMPPLEEQHAIITEVEWCMSLIDRSDSLVDTNVHRASRLRQSILKRAFEGKLVEQDPTDEPAAKLLEGIKAATPASRPRKKK